MSPITRDSFFYVSFLVVCVQLKDIKFGAANPYSQKCDFQNSTPKMSYIEKCSFGNKPWGLLNGGSLLGTKVLRIYDGAPVKYPDFFLK